MLFKIFKKSKPKALKDYLGYEFEDKLIPVEMPNVGTYREGSLTKIKKTTNEFRK